MTRRNPRLQDCPVEFFFPTRAAPTTTLTLRGPDSGHTEGIDKRQVIQVTPADEMIVYTRGPKSYSVDISLSFLNRAQRDALESFWDTHADGAAETFEVTIPDYSTAMDDGSLTRWTHYTGCEFEIGTIEFAETHNGFFSVSLQMRASGKAFV